MQRHVTPTLIAALLLTSAAASVSAQDMPRRKSGLWEIKMDNSAAKGGPGHTMTQCVDSAKDDLIGQQVNREVKCTQTNLQKGAGRLSFDSSCDFGTMKTTSSTSITGDFNSAYRMEIKSKYSPAVMGMTEGTTTMEAKYMGACRPGQRPGDVSMPGGMTMNVYDMMEGKKK